MALHNFKKRCDLLSLNFLKVDEKKKLKREWLEFCLNIGTMNSIMNKFKLQDEINKINDTFFPDQIIQNCKVISSLHSFDQPSSYTQQESFKISSRKESTGKFERTNQACHLLLDHFIKDSDMCIYFPKERFISKMKSDPEYSSVIDIIEETVHDLNKIHNLARSNEKTCLLDTKFNTAVGALVVKFQDDSKSVFPIQNINKKEEETFQNKEIDKIYQTIIENYEKQKNNWLIRRSNLNMDISSILLENLEDLKNKIDTIPEFVRVPKLEIL